MAGERSEPIFDNDGAGSRRTEEIADKSVQLSTLAGKPSSQRDADIPVAAPNKRKPNLAIQILVGCAIGFAAAYIFIWPRSYHNDISSRMVSRQDDDVLGSTTAQPAAFKYVTERDEFSGAYIDFVRVEDQAGRSFMIGKPDKTQSNLVGNVAFVMQPNQYICSSSGRWTLVDFITQVDNVSVPHGQFRWEVTRNNRLLIIKPGEIADGLFAALKKAQQLRFRYSDDCGDVVTLIFDASGLEAALSQLAVGF